MSEIEPPYGTPEGRAHELYWHSNRGVNAIAEELGLSKSRLYEAIQPIPAGSPCPECGRELVFETRTARDRAEATCPDGCGGLDEGTGGPTATWEPADPRKVLAGVMLGAAACFLIVRFIRR